MTHGRQEEVFAKNEGDQWYLRNRQAIEDPARLVQDPVLEMIRRSGAKPKRILEIGCSNGWRLHALARRYPGAECLGIDPSREAIREGARRSSRVQFRRGVAEQLPLPEGKPFDLVIVYFVLHWVSRDALLRSIAEIDRAVADGGRLIVGDFAPPRPTRVPYHHLPGQKIYTYKLSYDRLFFDTGFYRQIRRRFFNHSTLSTRLPIPVRERAFCSLLEKSYATYAEGTRR